MVISSSYHLFRAKLILYRFGILARTVPAKTPMSALIPSYVRETFAVVKTFLYDKPTEEDIKNLKVVLINAEGGLKLDKLPEDISRTEKGYKYQIKFQKDTKNLYAIINAQLVK